MLQSIQIMLSASLSVVGMLNAFATEPVNLRCE